MPKPKFTLEFSMKWSLRVYILSRVSQINWNLKLQLFSNVGRITS